MNHLTAIIQRFVSLAFLFSLFVPAYSFAYPVIDQLVPTAGLPIKVYRDYENPNMYWYIPQSIEPWTRDGRYQSSLYQTDAVLSFVFRGQASVDPEMLKTVAAAIGVPVANLSPISYDYSKDLLCQNFYAGDPSVQWLFPKMIGNYLEVVPISLRTTNRDLVSEIGYHLHNGGLGCVVSVGFKAVSTAYKLLLTANLNVVYHRFEANAHAGGLWWETDIHTLLTSLYRDHTITISSLEDASLPPSELDKKFLAALDEITKNITSALFNPMLKLPDGPMEGRGMPWSLRADYRDSQENDHFSEKFVADKVQVKDTQISIRMAVK